MNYKGYEIEQEYVPLVGDYIYHIKKDGKYVLTNLISRHSAKINITKIINQE